MYIHWQFLPFFLIANNNDTKKDPGHVTFTYIMFHLTVSIFRVTRLGICSILRIRATCMLIEWNMIVTSTYTTYMIRYIHLYMYNQGCFLYFVICQTFLAATLKRKLHISMGLFSVSSEFCPTCAQKSSFMIIKFGMNENMS